LCWLSAQSEQKARLTGSGSAIFAQFPTQSAAMHVLQQKPALFEGFVAKGIDYLPWANVIGQAPLVEQAQTSRF
jgi:4-diphosphocytidyl-2-C-methyl-D-erythritol kinase